jgi:endonuclease/exonuclease/phosphatase family metal-dependent hydrolase
VSELRVVSYNVHGLHDDRAALVEVVRELAPDLLLLQEAPRRLGWRTRCAALAHDVGMVVAEGGSPGLGNLIVTDLRVRVGQTWCVRFPLTPGRHLRGAAVARCAVAGVRFVVAGTHLGTDPAERPSQARLLREALAGLGEPLIIGGDLNDQPGSETWKTVADGLTDTGEPDPTATFSRPDPRGRIDAIFADPSFEILSYEVVDTPPARRASDHFPVAATLRLPR